MSPSLLATRTLSSPIVHRLAPWIVVLVVGGLLIGVLPSAEAQTGATAADAIPIQTDGRFAGTTPPGAKLWYKFNYIGNNQTSTITVTFQPTDSNRLDVFLFTGDPANPTQSSASSTLTANVRTIQFTDPGSARVVFVRVDNDHTDRSVSFVGAVTPTATIATPTATSATSPGTPQSTPTAGPVAQNASSAITLVTTGQFAGTLGFRQAVWYRFYYGNPGADAEVTVSLAPNATSADLNVYTGTDPTNLGPPQGGSQVVNGNTISRHVNLPNAQFVFFSLANNNDAQILAYSGNVTPFITPPATVTPTTPTAAVTSTAVAAPTSTPQAAPPLTRDARYFNETRFRIDDDAIYSYFQARGAVETFGFPVSRTFTFLGCSVQIFQRQIAQRCAGGSVALMNVLDPEIFPYTRVNGSIFPPPDDALKNSTPPVGSPNYSTAILQFVRDNAPNQAFGQPVNFGTTFFSSVTPQMAGTSDPNLLGLFSLEIWGAPISQPAQDPGNSNFIYQRFQRGIMHYTANQGTRGILLADYVKQIMIGTTLPAGGNNPNLPTDLAQQAQGSRFFDQYCPGGTRWLCRPNDMPDSNLTYAFETG